MANGKEMPVAVESRIPILTVEALKLLGSQVALKMLIASILAELKCY